MKRSRHISLITAVLLFAGCSGQFGNTDGQQGNEPVSVPGVGAVAPGFKLPRSTDGAYVTLSELLVDGPVLLAFFPAAFAPG